MTGMTPQDQVKEHICPNCRKPYSQVLHTSCTSTPTTSTQGQAQLEERRAGKILLDLIDTRARTIAREELASMAGLALRRTQDLHEEVINDDFAIKRAIAHIFGELLRDYSQTTDEPGE